jgi:protein TonB
MNWQPKLVATTVTSLVCAIYFNVIFCEAIDRAGKENRQNWQVVDMKLTFTSKPQSAPTQKKQQNMPPETVSTPLEPKVDKPVVELKEPMSRLVAVPVQKTITEKKPVAKKKLNAELVKNNDDAKPNKQGLAKNSKASNNEDNSQPSTPAVLPNTSSTESLQSIRVESAMQRYMAQVRDHIAGQKRYPQAAKIRRHQGKVTISFIVAADGLVSQAKIVKSCKSRYINKSVKVLLSKLRFNVAPEAITAQFPKTVILDVIYQFG